MKGMTFETFRVDEGNRAAYDYCRLTATLQYEAGRPAMLLGPEGAGKSHLLWSITKHLRASSARVGLALVMASEFPDQLRQLALNPAPLQDGKPALLLVDDLQSFEDDAYALEGVVKAFLENGHGVLLASAVHPDRLLAFTDAFRSLLLAGDLIEIRPMAPLSAGEEEDIALLETLRLERDALEQKLAQKAAESADIAQVRARLDEAMRQVEQLTLALADTSRFDYVHEQHQIEMKGVIAERESYRLAVDGLREERDVLEKRLAERTSAAAEADMLRERLLTMEAPVVDEQEIVRLRERLVAAETTHGEEAAHLEDEVRRMRSQLAQAEESATRANETQAALKERIDRLQAELSEYRGGLEEARALRKELEESHTALLATRAELDNAVQLAQAAEHALDNERTTAAGENESLRRAVRALVAQAQSRGPVDLREVTRLQDELTEAQSLSAAFRLQMDRDRRAFEEEAERLRAEHAELQSAALNATTGQVRDASTLEMVRNQCKTLEYELEKARKHNSLLTAEMDALRNEAATQVAQANIQAGEMESRMGRLHDALEVALHRGKSAAQHAEALSAAFVQASEALLAAREDLAAISLPPAASPEETARIEAIAQAHLFDTAPFMRELAALPGTFDAPAMSTDFLPEDPVPSERPLHELVEEALTRESPLQP